MTWRWRLRKLWRRKYPPIFHPAYLGERNVCRWCSKMLVHGRNYGMGEGRLLRWR